MHAECFSVEMLIWKRYCIYLHYVNKTVRENMQEITLMKSELYVVNLEDGGEVFLTSLPKTIHILYSTRIFTLNQHRFNASRIGGSEENYTTPLGIHVT